jgi:toxin ParE1/3/4
MIKKKLIVELAPNAELNLIEIEDYISGKAGSAIAVSVVDLLLETCASLQTMPRIGRAREDIAPGIRSLAAGKYVIYYRIKARSIEILRIWHGHRDTSALRKKSL